MKIPTNAVAKRTATSEQYVTAALLSMHQLIKSYTQFRFIHVSVWRTGDAYSTIFAVVARDSELTIALPSTSTDGKYLS